MKNKVYKEWWSRKKTLFLPKLYRLLILARIQQHISIYHPRKIETHFLRRRVVVVPLFSFIFCMLPSFRSIAPENQKKNHTNTTLEFLFSIVEYFEIFPNEKRIYASVLFCARISSSKSFSSFMVWCVQKNVAWPNNVFIIDATGFFFCAVINKQERIGFWFVSFCAVFYVSAVFLTLSHYDL